MSCPQTGSSLDICPSQDEIIPQLLALLPRGRAWGTDDVGPHPGSTLYSFWYAVAGIWAWINRRICDLAAEFFCATQDETHDVWLEEYGLPDGCDPYPDLCSKVAAFGGSRCEYYRAVAARAGWAIVCTDVDNSCGVKSGRLMAGCSTVGLGLGPSVLLITVDLAESPAFIGGAPGSTATTAFGGIAQPFAGRMQAGGTLACASAGELTLPFAGAMFAGGLLSCPPDLTALECLLARIVGAHILMIFETLLTPSASVMPPAGPTAGGDGTLDFSNVNDSGLIPFL